MMWVENDSTHIIWFLGGKCVRRIRNNMLAVSLAVILGVNAVPFGINAENVASETDAVDLSAGEELNAEETTAGKVELNSTNFPDENFLKKLKEIDADGDGWLVCADVKELDLAGAAVL
jgi:hypothetical protein